MDFREIVYWEFLQNLSRNLKFWLKWDKSIGHLMLRPKCVFVFYKVGSDICSVAVQRTHCLLPCQRLQVCMYVCQQYKGNALSRVNGNSGYANALQCYNIRTLPTSLVL